MSLLEIDRMARRTVSGYHFETVGMAEVLVIVKRQQLVGEAVVEQLPVKDAALRDQMFYTYIIISCQIVDVRDACASGLT